MLKPICFTLIIFVLFIANLKAQTIPSNSKIITINGGWNLRIPDYFTCKGYHNIDSYMGTISSEKDSIKLKFDIINGIVGLDCSLEAQTKTCKNILKFEMIVKPNDILNISRVYIDTIHNRIAVIVVPQSVGKGETKIHISDCLSGSDLFMAANDLNAEQQKLVLDIFQTIKYLKEGKIYN